MSEILALKTEQINDNSENKFEIEFSVETPLEFKNDIDSTHLMIVNKMNSVDQLLEENQKIIDSYNKEIYYLTNHSDGIDYTVAVASGIIAGVIDIVFVGDFSFDQANLDGDKLADKIVVSTAKMKGYKGNDVPGAIRHLEKNFTIAADTKTKQFGGGKQHHLRDFSHHPNLSFYSL